MAYGGPAKAGESRLEPGVSYRRRRFHGYLNRVQIAIVSGFLSVMYGALRAYAVRQDNRPPHNIAIFSMVLRDEFSFAKIVTIMRGYNFYSYRITVSGINHGYLGSYLGSTGIYIMGY